MRQKGMIELNDIRYAIIETRQIDRIQNVKRLCSTWVGSGLPA